MAINPKRFIGPEVFKVRQLLCSSHSGKGTGLECGSCVRDLSEERDRLRTRVEELTWMYRDVTELVDKIQEEVLALGSEFEPTERLATLLALNVEE